MKWWYITAVKRFLTLAPGGGKGLGLVFNLSLLLKINKNGRPYFANH
jgi:hypothetical protein